MSRGAGAIETRLRSALPGAAVPPAVLQGAG